MRSLLLLGLSAALLVGLFFALRSETGPGAPGADGRAGVAEAPEGRPAAPDELAAVDEAESSRAAAPAVESAPSPSAPRAGAARRAEDSDRPKGAVVARVIDPDGGPLAGVTAALADEFDVFLGGDRDGGLSRTAETDEDGRLRIEADAGRPELRIGLDGYAPFAQSVDVTPGRDTDLGEIQLAAGVRLAGRVLDDRGRPVPGAKIVRPTPRGSGLIRLGGSGETAAETDADGRFEILRQAVGPFEFWVDHADYPRERFSGETSRAGEFVSGIEVTMRVGERITGTVASLGEEGLVVMARPVGGESITAGLDEMVDGFRSLGRRGRIAADGTFVVQGLEEGRQYRLWLRTERDGAWNTSTRRSASVEARSGESGVVLTYSAGRSLRWTLRGPDGEAITDARVSAGTNYRMPVDNLVVDSATGTYAMLNLWPPSNGTDYALEISAKGYQLWTNPSVAFAPTGATDLGVIEMEARPQLVVTVVDGRTARPVEGARVIATKAEDPLSAGSRRITASFSASADDVDVGDFLPGGDQASSVTDEEGRCSLDVTPGDRVWVDVIHPGFAELRHGPVALSADESRFESRVELGPGGTVEVLVLDHTGVALPGARVEVRGDEGRPAPRSQESDAEGRARFEGLAAGAYGFRLDEKRARSMVMVVTEIGGQTSGEGWTEVQVLPGEERALTLHAKEPSGLTGRITEAGVPLAGAKVELRKANDPLAGLSFGLGGGNSATTDARGRYRLDDVEQGEMVLVVQHATRAMDHEEPIEVEAGDNDRDVDLTITTIEGRVVGPGGDPIAGARVEVKRDDPSGPGQRMVFSVVMAGPDDGDGATFVGGSPGNPDAVFTDEDGRYLLRGVQPGVALVVEASAKGLDKTRTESFELKDGDAKSGVDLSFVQTGSLTVLLEGAEGGAMAVLRKRGESARDPRVEQLSGASTTIEGLEPGRWEVRISPLGLDGDGASFSPDSEAIDVVAGETASVTFTRSE